VKSSADPKPLYSLKKIEDFQTPHRFPAPFKKEIIHAHITKTIFRLGEESSNPPSGHSTMRWPECRG